MKEGQSSNQSEAVSESSGGGSVGSGSYTITAQELAEFGLSENDSTDGGTFSAEAPPQKEQRLAKAKAKAEPKAKEDDAEIDLGLNEDEADDWLKTKLTDDEEEAPETADVEDEETFELLRKGRKIALKKSEALDYAQKGFDYETRNNELKAEKQAFERERNQWGEQVGQLRQDYEKIKTEKEQIDALVEFIRDSDSDLYASIERYAGEFNRQYNNPIMSRFMQQLEAKIESKLGGIEKFSTETKSNNLKTEFYNQLNELQRIHDSKFSKYGIDLDEEAIKKEWVETGLPLKKIYGQLYGDKLLALAESKKQLNIKKNAASKAPTMGRVKTAAKPAKDVNGMLKKMSYSRIADMVSRGELR